MFILARKMSMFLLSKTWEIPFRDTFADDEAISNPSDSSRIGHSFRASKMQ